MVDIDIQKYMRDFSDIYDPQDIVKITRNDNFVFHIMGARNLSALVKDFSLPSVSLGHVEVAGRFKSYYRPGDISYGSLSLTFFVDGGWKNYFFMKKWLEELSGLEGYNPNLTDGLLVLYGNDNKVRDTLLFRGLLPEDVGSVSFATSGSEIYLTFDVSFKIQEYLLVDH